MRKSKEVDELREETLQYRAVGLSICGLHKYLGIAEMIGEFTTLPTTIMSAAVELGATIDIDTIAEVASHSVSYDTSY